MGIVQRAAERMLWWVLDKGETRSSLENPSTPLSYPAEWLLDIFNGGRTDSGIRVSEMTALQTSAVLACVKIVCNGIATLPLHVYERQVRDNGRIAKRMAHEHNYYDMLRANPNPEMTAHTWRSVQQLHMLLWGNGYSEIQRDNGNRIIALWPRNPARTRPVRLTSDARIEGTKYPRGTLVYHTSETMGDEISAVDESQNAMAPERIILAEDMLHIPGLSLDGRLGQSTVYLARQIVGLALATEKFGAKFFGNGAVPRGILEVTGVLEPKAVETLRRSWQEAHGGENTHKTAILEQGVKYTPIGIDPEKSQFLETRRHQAVEVAAIFNVPPHMIGESTERSKGSVEQTSIEFLNYCLNPWLDAWEQELKRKMFPSNPINSKQSKFFAKFDTNRLLYPDAETRSKYYDSGKNTGWLNTNDIHEHEDLNPVEDGSGEVYWAPVNMVNAATGLLVGATLKSIKAQAQAQAEGQAAGNPKPNPQLENVQGGAPKNKPASKPKPKTKPKRSHDVARLTGVYYPLFIDGFGRFMDRKNPDLTDFVRVMSPTVTTVVCAINLEAETGLLSPVELAEYNSLISAHIAGMYSKMKDVTPEMKVAHAHAETVRTIETFLGVVEARYNRITICRSATRTALGTMVPSRSSSCATGRRMMTRIISGTGWRPQTINDQGLQDVATAAEALKGHNIRRIISSNLARTKDTAQLVANALLVPISLDPRLNALDLGIFAGLNEDENAHALQLFLNNPDTPITGGESLNNYIERTQGAINEAADKNEDTGPILVVTHSSGIGTYLSGGDPASLDSVSQLLSPGGVLHLMDDNVSVLCGKLSKGDAA